MKGIRSFTRGYGVLENYLAKKRARMADRLIPENLRNGRVLDVGCGVEPYFLINTTFKEKYGIDPNTEGKHFGQQVILKNIAVVQNEPLPFEDGFFDAVTMLGVIEHFDEATLSTFFRDSKRILRPGGRLIVLTPAPWSDILIKGLAWLRLISPSETKEMKGSYSRKDLTRILVQAGFNKENIVGGYFECFLNSWIFSAC